MCSNRDNSPSREEVKERDKFYPAWMYSGEVLFEPLVFTFAVYMLFARIQHIITTSEQHGLWKAAELDMYDHPLIYAVFLAVFVIWVIYRAKRASREYRFRKEDRELHLEMLKELKSLKRRRGAARRR